MRIVVLAAVIGIAAAGLAYAVSPEVRHAVGHAAHAVKHSVGNLFDNDEKRRHDDRSKRGRRRQGAHEQRSDKGASSRRTEPLRRGRMSRAPT
jgi:copper oxidase (laccase) domain-containing protein